MSLSNITPAVRSSLEKYKEKYQKLKENSATKGTENKSLKEELLKYQVEVRTLRRGFSENGIYCGRNTTSWWKKRGEWDQTDLCNNNIIKSFCKNNWITKNKGKHFLDMVTMSDIEYMVAVIENRYEA